MARQALDSVRGTALADVLQVAFAKLTHGMLDRIQFSWSSLDEAFQVMRWVLVFGSQAKVLGPPELLRMVRDEVRKMSDG